MLENTDTLLAMAEIAAAFAGFAALVSVIRRASDQPADAVHDLLRLRLVISSSVAGVAGALIPVGLAGYGLDVGLIWRLAAIILSGFRLRDHRLLRWELQTGSGSFPAGSIGRGPGVCSGGGGAGEPFRRGSGDHLRERSGPLCHGPHRQHLSGRVHLREVRGLGLPPRVRNRLGMRGAWLRRVEAYFALGWWFW